MKEFLVNSVEETFQVANKIAEIINMPAIILLHGDLGAGKTHFVKGFAKALGCEDLVTSPTFTIMNEYLGGKFPIYHFDMYRLQDCEEARMLGFDEYFDMKSLKGISIVEWPENVNGLIDYEKVVDIQILKRENQDERLIRVRGELCW